MVYKRGKVYWFEFQYKGERVRESANTTNKQAALNVEAERRTQIVSGVPQNTVENHNFVDAFAQFLSWAASHVRPNTLKRYRVSGKRLGTHFGRYNCFELGARIVEAFKMVRSAECSNAGVNRDLACLRTFFNWAIRLGYIKENPCRGIKMLPEGQGVMNILSPDNEDVFLLAAPQPLKDIAILMLNTGMRPNEVYACKGRNVNPQAHYVFVPEGKTKSARRTIPLNQEALSVLERRSKLHGEGYLFPHRRDPEKHMVICRSHLTVCKNLGLNFRLYDLRHTFGSRMAMAGVDLATLKELMGHTTIQMTMRYVHPTPEHKRAAIAKLPTKIPTVVESVAVNY